VVGRRIAVSALTAISAVTFLAGLKYAGVTMGTVLSSASCSRCRSGSSPAGG
jgi:hypothetical protein